MPAWRVSSQTIRASYAKNAAPLFAGGWCLLKDWAFVSEDIFDCGMEDVGTIVPQRNSEILGLNASGVCRGGTEGFVAGRTQEGNVDLSGKITILKIAAQEAKSSKPWKQQQSCGMKCACVCVCAGGCPPPPLLGHHSTGYPAAQEAFLRTQIQKCSGVGITGKP